MNKEQLTIETALDDFKMNFKIENKNTKKSYDYAMRVFTSYLMEKFDITTDLLWDLNVKDCSDFGSWMTDHNKEAGRKPYSERTQKVCLVVMKRFLNYFRVLGLVSFSAEKEGEMERASKVVSKKKHDQAAMASLVDEDFGDKMLMAAQKHYQSVHTEITTMPKLKARLHHLNGLRTMVLVSVLWSTGLRISDTLNLKKDDYLTAKRNQGFLKVTMIKTGGYAHVCFSQITLKVIEDYLAERNDNSPWLFIQHGRGGRRQRKVIEQFYLEHIEKHKGYGMRLGDDSARTIVKRIASLAGYVEPPPYLGADGKRIPHRKGENGQYNSPHAFRHWLASSLKKMGMPIDDIQNILGHASPETTKTIYAPNPNTENILLFLKKLHGDLETLV